MSFGFIRLVVSGFIVILKSKGYFIFAANRLLYLYEIFNQLGAVRKFIGVYLLRRLLIIFRGKLIF